MKKLSFFIIILVCTSLSAQNYPSLNNQKINGYKGIWFLVASRAYSGGLGTYTEYHTPLAIYSPEVQKTFFVFGGTIEGRKSNLSVWPPTVGSEYGDYLLCMVGCFDHKTQTVSKPTVVHDKGGIHDPHENSTIAMDADGYIWVFVNGRGSIPSRPGTIYKSRQPYNVDAFDLIDTQVGLAYAQPKYVKDKGFIVPFTYYYGNYGNRQLQFITSPDGHTWSEKQLLFDILQSPESGEKRGGHYQTSGQWGEKIGFFCQWLFWSNNILSLHHMNTNLYYLQTVDFGKTWTKADGSPVSLPVTEADDETLVREFLSKNQHCYVKDMTFDEKGNPMLLYLYGTGRGAALDAGWGMKTWAVLYWNGKEWENHDITTSDHNWDMGSIWTTNGKWSVIAPTDPGPQTWHTGGELVLWESTDNGNTWKRTKQVTKNSPRNHTYARKVINGVDPFMYFWADGNADEPSISKLYFGDSKGNVWQLPYTMTKDTQKPQKGQK